MSKFKQPEGVSSLALGNRKMRSRLFMSTRGRCFYCGHPISEAKQQHEHDWLLVDEWARRMVREHKIPSSRGGDNSDENCVPACARCNADKGQFTTEEYRFVRGLATGIFPFRFDAEPDATRRDWLICASEGPHHRALLLHNMPDAKAGVPRMRPVNSGHEARQ